MKKTETYQLNQWEMSDRIRMEDFNADNVRLESALEGKTGRFQKIYSYSPGDGENSAGANFHIRDWSEWEEVVIIYDLHKTTFLPDDYFVLKPQHSDLTHSPELGRIAGGSFVLALFPWHDKTALARGVVIGNGSTTFLLDRTFEETIGLSIFLKNTNSTHYAKDSTTKFVSPVWSIYGRK